MRDTVYIFHYHLLPGGVTTVIRDGVRALLAHGELLPQLRRIVVVSSGDAGPGGGGALPAEIARDRLDAVGYDDTPATPAAQRQLCDLLLQRYGDGVWWIHNHHLAKNTRFTGALLLAAAAGQPLVLQIHDFPECGRPANLRRLRREVPASPYPIGSNVRYAVLNRRDQAALHAAGIPAKQVTLLANPVRPVAPLPPPASQRAAAARAALARAAAPGDHSAPAFAAPHAGAASPLPPGPTPSSAAFGSGSLDPARPLWLYPVRVRRRKNVLEAGLLARLCAANLVVTLPASSVPETPYSRHVQALFVEGAIPGLFGIGEQLDAHGISFDELVTAAHLIVSSSVEEGFGFQFVNTLQWRRPLLARRLPVLADLTELLADYPAVVYDAVRCPLSAAQRTALAAAYRPSLARAADLLPPPRLERLHAELDAIITADAADFSFLDVAQQTAVLRRSTDPGFRRDLEALNRDLLARVAALEQATPPDRTGPIDRALGTLPFARRAADLLRPLLAEPADEAAVTGARAAAVAEFFTTPAAMRLLMES